MDRVTVYPLQLPREVDILSTGKSAMVGLGGLTQATLGTGTVVDGFSLTPTAPASMTLSLGPGYIYQSENVDGSAWSTLPADSHTIQKQGIALDSQAISFTAPTTTGYSQAFLIEAQYLDVDDANVVLPYYNAANPQIGLQGPGGNGQSQPTKRRGAVSIQVKAGVAGSAGTQVAPTPDAGWAPLYVVTLNAGQTSITNASIALAQSAPFIPVKLPGVPAGVQSGVWTYAVATGTNALSASLSPTPPALTEGLTFGLRCPNANTGQVSLALNGFAAAPVVRKDGSALQAGDIASGEVVRLTYSSGVFGFVNFARSEITAAPSQLWHTGTASGTAQALTVANLSAPITDYSSTEVPCLIRLPFAINPGATINFNGIGQLPILRAGGGAVQNGDAPPPILFGTIHSDGFRLIGLGRAEVQQIVNNVTLYVRPDGSDANDGSANDAGHAFQTIAAALASAVRFSNTSTVSLQLGAPGTFAAPGALPKTGASFQILGDAGNPQNFNINGAGTQNTPPILVAGASLILNGVQVNNTGTINNTLGANLGGSITTTNCILTSVNGNVNYHAAAFAAGGIVIGDGTRFAGPMGGMVSANGGTIVIGGAASAVNVPNWSTGGVAAVGSGNVSLVAGGSLTGAATGPRYYLTTNGVINTNGAGVNYFPGDVAGVQQSGGQYV